MALRISESPERDNAEGQAVDENETSRKNSRSIFAVIGFFVLMAIALWHDSPTVHGRTQIKTNNGTITKFIVENNTGDNHHHDHQDDHQDEQLVLPLSDADAVNSSNSNSSKRKNGTSSSCEIQTMGQWTVITEWKPFENYTEFTQVLLPDQEVMKNKNDSHQHHHHQQQPPEALCYFNGIEVVDQHFPHAMEQLYTCWSFFQAHKGKQPVLLYPSKFRKKRPYQPRLEKLYREQQQQQQKQPPTQPWSPLLSPNQPYVDFFDGFLSFLVEGLNVTVRPILPINDVPDPTVPACAKFIKNNTATTTATSLFTSQDSVLVKTFCCFTLARNDPPVLARQVLQQKGSLYHPHEEQNTTTPDYDVASWSNDDVLEHLINKYHPPTNNNQQHDFSGQQQQHRHLWATKLMGPKKKKENTTNVVGTKPKCRCGNQHGQPTISILNRKGSREILNVGAVVEALEQSLSRNHDPPPRVQVFYMEGVSFLDQVAYFANVDILISPHGAQLTGLPFLASARSSSLCGAFLEIFPPQYCIPWYFGPLAGSSGLNYSYLALQTRKDTKRNVSSCSRIEGYGKKVGRAQAAARGVKICPNVAQIVEAVQNIVAQWKQCCCAI